MSLTSIRKYNSTNSIELSDQQFSFSHKQINLSQQNWADQFTELQLARSRFIQFAETISNKNKEIRQDIILHCEHNSKKQKPHQSYLNYEIVMNLVSQRIEKMVKNKRIKKNWSDEDVQILIWVISKYSDMQGIKDIEKDLNQEDWVMIASLIPGVTPQSCMFKWLSLKKINLATNSWEEEEAALLASIIQQTGNKNNKKESKDWKLISQKLYFSSTKPNKIFRNAKQCRQHWNCYLNPNLKKGPWTDEQDVLLLRSIKQNNGNKRWSQIVRHFDGRTENALKNRYNLIVQKQKKQNKNKTQLEIIDQYLQKCYIGQFTSEINQNQSQQSFISLISLQPPNYKSNNQLENDKSSMRGQTNQPNLERSPITIKTIDFKSMISLSKQDLIYMQPGVILNGVFEKTQITDINQLEQSSNFRLKKYSSSKF